MLAPVKFLTLAATIVGFEALATFFVSEFIADRAASVLVCTRHISREPLVDVVVGVADRAGGDFVVSREPLVDAGCDVVVSVADRVHGGFAFTGLVIHLHCAQAMVAVNNDGGGVQMKSLGTQMTGLRMENFAMGVVGFVGRRTAVGQMGHFVLVDVRPNEWRH